MKKIILALIVTATAWPFLAQSQTTAPDFQKGTVVTAANEKMDGTIRNQAKKKGTIVFTSASGQKKTYTPAELSGFTVNGVNYISYASDFYKVVASGNKASLYQRISDNSGKMLYNGPEAVSITTAEGIPGDYYLQAGADSKLLWVTQKNFEGLVSSAFSDCAAVLSDIKNKQIGYSQISKAVEKYNSCH